MNSLSLCVCVCVCDTQSAILEQMAMLGEAAVADILQTLMQDDLVYARTVTFRQASLFSRGFWNEEDHHHHHHHDDDEAADRTTTCGGGGGGGGVVVCLFARPAAAPCGALLRL